MKPLVYVASPYTKGDPCVNANFQCRVFDQMLNDGIVIPYIPLWSHFQHSVAPRPYTDWIEYDNIIVPKCDALVRLNAEFVWPDGKPYSVSESSGADNEVKLAEKFGKPVFYTVEALYEWAKSRDHVFTIPTGMAASDFVGNPNPFIASLQETGEEILAAFDKIEAEKVIN